MNPWILGTAMARLLSTNDRPISGLARSRSAGITGGRGRGSFDRVVGIEPLSSPIAQARAERHLGLFPFPLAHTRTGSAIFVVPPGKGFVLGIRLFGKNSASSVSELARNGFTKGLIQPIQASRQQR
jgi:hypothetical protein